MKKLFTLALVGCALSLTACASQRGDSNYGYETQAPYADERTEGAMEAPPKAEKVFHKAQMK